MKKLISLALAAALLHLERQDDAISALADGAKATSGETRTALAAAQAEVEKSAVDGYIGLSSAYEMLGWREIALALLRRVCGELPEEGRLREALERVMEDDESNTEMSVAATIMTEATKISTTINAVDLDDYRDVTYEELAQALGCILNGGWNTEGTSVDKLGEFGPDRVGVIWSSEKISILVH